MYAPPFPRWLLAPGFWDECYCADIRIDRLFAALVYVGGKPVRLSSYLKGWRPDRLTIMHVAGKMVMREIRCVTEDQAWVSEFELVTDVGPVDLVFWSAQSAAEGPPPCSRITGCERLTRDGRAEGFVWDFEVRFPSEMSEERLATDAIETRTGGPSVNSLRGGICIAIGSDEAPLGVATVRSEFADTPPWVEASPAYELFREGRLEAMSSELGAHQFHMLSHCRLSDRKTVQFGAAAGEDRESATNRLRDALSSRAQDRSAAAWKEYFAQVPHFECSDPYLTHAYWNRWFGLRLSSVDRALSAYPHPCIFEGVGAFRNLISYSGWCHARETAWMRNPEMAKGVFRSFAHAQLEDGSFPGHTYSIRAKRDFYHGNWGDAIRLLCSIHPDESLAEEACSSLARYADFLARERDPDSEGLINVHDQNETGQEYSSRYAFVAQADDDWAELRMQGVDATTYAWRLSAALAELAKDGEIRAKNEMRAERYRASIEKSLWDGVDAFRDRDPRTGTLSPNLNAVGFYPLAYEPFATENEAAVHRHLLNEGEFWTPYPVATAPRNDPTYSPSAIWRGTKRNCPWNGRVWPMVNSHMVETLAASPNLDVRKSAGELLMRWVRMMCFADDPTRPNCFEHYNPETGAPSAYRGVDDYMHSWLVDLILRHVCGVDPGAPGFEGPRLDCGLEWLTVSNLRVAGQEVEREWRA